MEKQTRTVKRTSQPSTPAGDHQPAPAPAEAAPADYAEKLDALVADFKRQAHVRFERNVGNVLTEELATGLYHFCVGTVDELIRRAERVITDAS